MLRHLVFVGASTATLIVSAPAFAATSQCGTAEEARAIRMNFAALGMSAYGTKRTKLSFRCNV